MGDEMKKRAMVGAKTNKQTSGASDIKTSVNSATNPKYCPTWLGAHHSACSTVNH